MDQGTAYSTFIDEELKAERERWQKIETRGMSIVGSSAGIVALMAAVAAIAGSSKDIGVPDDAQIPLVLAVAAFGVASVLGLLAGFVRPYKVADIETLRHMLRTHWGDHEIDAKNNVATVKVTTLESIRLESNRRIKLLIAGLATQILGTIALIAVVAVVASQAPQPAESESLQPRIWEVCFGAARLAIGELRLRLDIIVWLCSNLDISDAMKPAIPCEVTAPFTRHNG